MSNFECGYCHNTFVREGAFIKHKCKQMKRAEEIQTPLGQAGYSFYGKWNRAYNRRVPAIQQFVDSKFYTVFVNCAKHHTLVKLADVDLFIKLMKQKDLPPNMWRRDEVYSLYLEYLDRQCDPIDRARITMNELCDIAEELQVPLDQVFTKFSVSETMELIRQRKLTPWILLKSSSFKQLLIRASPEERSIFENLIRPAYWRFKFDQQPEIVAIMTALVSEMNI